MAEPKQDDPKERLVEPAQEEAPDEDAFDHQDFDLQPGEGRMSGARTGRSGGAHEDEDVPPPGSTPEGRSGS